VSKHSGLSEAAKEVGNGRYFALRSEMDTGLFRRLTSRNLLQRYPVYRIDTQKLMVDGEIIVQFKPDVGATRAKEVLALFSHQVITRGLEANSYTVRITNADSTLAVANTLNQRTDVLYSQPNFLHVADQLPRPHLRPKLFAALAAPVFPSDEYFPQQWGMENKNSNASQGNAGADIRIKGAWNVTHGSAGVIVAIIDEGVDASHQDLRGKIIENVDAFDGGDGLPNQGDSHGTNCAGIIAATPNNGIGIAGVAWDTRILSIRVIRTTDGVSEYSTETISNGLRLAAEKGAHIISMSMVMSPEIAIRNQIDYALFSGARGKMGTIVVFPSGDTGVSGVSFPCSLSSSRPIICVGASNEWDEVKSQTSQDNENFWGSNTGKEVTVVAPGVHVCTTDLVVPNAVPYVCDFRGTSAAVPHVAGIAALILSKNPIMTAAEVRTRIASTADKLGPASFSEDYGWGRVNACRALASGSCP
jgi:thermitase